MALFDGDCCTIHTDCSFSTGEPKHLRIGYTIRTPKGDLLAEVGQSLSHEIGMLPPGRRGPKPGRYTNPSQNVGEYMAVIIAMRHALRMGVRKVEVYSDSELIVNQLLGTFAVKHPNLKPLNFEATQLARAFDRAYVNWVSRDKNTEADGLSRRVVYRTWKPDVRPPLSRGNVTIKPYLNDWQAAIIRDRCGGIADAVLGRAFLCPPRVIGKVKEGSSYFMLHPPAPPDFTKGTYEIVDEETSPDPETREGIVSPRDWAPDGFVPAASLPVRHLGRPPRRTRASHDPSWED